MPVTLSKGQRIGLMKSDGLALKSFCVGANWGSLPDRRPVDLDLHAALYSSDNKLIEHVYFARQSSHYNAVFLTEDDRTGDGGADDGQDNEVLSIHLDRLPPTHTKVVFFLCCNAQDDLSAVPHASLRIYEGLPYLPTNIMANYRVEGEARYAGHRCIAMGMVYLHGEDWRFNAMGLALKASEYREALLELHQILS